MMIVIIYLSLVSKKVAFIKYYKIFINISGLTSRRKTR